MSQRKIFTSTPHKQKYSLGTGQTTVQSQKNPAKNLSDVNTDASHVYRVVLWASQDTGSSSKKKKSWSTQKKSKKNQKETEFSNSQNLDKDNSYSGVSHNGKNKTEDELADQKENAKQKVKNVRQHEKRAKYKLQINKEVQKLFSQKFSDDKRKNSHHLQNRNTSLQMSNQKKYSKKICSFKSQDRTDKEISGTCEISKYDNKDYSDQNETDNMIDIWSLSKDINSDNNYNFHNRDPQTGLQLEKNITHEKVTVTKTVTISKNDVSNFSKNKDFKKMNASVENCYFQAKYTGSVKATTKSDTKVMAKETTQNSQKVPSSPSVHSSQIYEFPNFPDTGKEQLEAKVKKKRNMKKKQDLKNDLAVDQILKVISQTKMEMESIREKMFKKKTKHK